jgi:hypothetical protein
MEDYSAYVLLLAYAAVILPRAVTKGYKIYENWQARKVAGSEKGMS